MTTESPTRTEFVPPLVLRLRPAIVMDDDQLLEFCAQNKELRIERNAEGDLEIMAPTGGETSDQNSELNMQLRMWAKQDSTGIPFDSNGGFVLPNGAMRSPDASWVPRKQLAALSAEQKRKFLPLCPDFVVELRSPLDKLTVLQDKMREYIENGARLGWLLDPGSRQAYVYRPGAEVERLVEASSLSADPELLGFVLDLREIWKPGF